MLQIINLENQEILVDISTEELTTVHGGGPLTGAMSSLIALVTAGPAFWSTPIVQGAIAAAIFNPNTP